MREPLRVSCPCPYTAMNRIPAAMSKNLTHTEMGLVLAFASSALMELSKLDCELEVAPASPGSGEPCLRVIAGAQSTAAKSVLERWAKAVMDSDPYSLTTLQEARVLFGL